MRRVIGIVGCVLVLGLTPARADTDPTDEVLQKFFPGRDLSKAKLKFVDEANGMYAVGDDFEVLRFGYVRTTNAVVVQQVRDVRGVLERAFRYTADKMVLSFTTPIRNPCDLRGNKIWVISPEK
jgi:hypothetical protein